MNIQSAHSPEHIEAAFHEVGHALIMATIDAEFEYVTITEIQTVLNRMRNGPPDTFIITVVIKLVYPINLIF